MKRLVLALCFIVGLCACSNSHLKKQAENKMARDIRTECKQINYKENTSLCIIKAVVENIEKSNEYPEKENDVSLIKMEVVDLSSESKPINLSMINNDSSIYYERDFYYISLNITCDFLNGGGKSWGKMIFSHPSYKKVFSYFTITCIALSESEATSQKTLDEKERQEAMQEKIRVAREQSPEFRAIQEAIENKDAIDQAVKLIFRAHDYIKFNKSILDQEIRKARTIGYYEPSTIYTLNYGIRSNLGVIEKNFDVYRKNGGEIKTVRQLLGETDIIEINGKLYFRGW